MKKTILSVFMFLLAVCTLGQKNLTVKYSVSNHDSDKGERKTTDMVLFANSLRSLFYNPMSLYVDSCESTPEGMAKLREIQIKAWRVVNPDGSVTLDGRKLGLTPDKQIYTYVDKDFSKSEITVYDHLAGDNIQYSEPSGSLEWTIVGDSIKSILNFECVMAKTNYHGRNWTVWFSPDIPLQDGPWKLHGLPGIILEADGGDGFIIVANEIGNTYQNVPVVYSTEKYERVDRRKILADHEYYINNLISQLSARGIKMNEDGSPMDLPRFNRKQRAWELDY